MSEILTQIDRYGLAGELILLVDLVIRIGFVLLVLSQARRSPESRIGWILLLLGIPLAGTIIFLLIGETNLGRLRIRRHRRIREALDRPEIHADGTPEARAHALLDRTGSHLARLAEQISGGAPVRGNQMELFGDTDKVIARMEQDIDAATRHCHFLFYIWLDDKAGTCIAEALIRAVERGVVCRVLVDAVGSKAFLRSSLCHRMKASGVKVQAALPANAIRAIFARLDLRNHRKIAVIDHELAWTGSQNLAEASFAPKPKYAPWVDCVVRIKGPVAKELHLLFVEGWYLDTDESLV